MDEEVEGERARFREAARPWIGNPIAGRIGPHDPPPVDVEVEIPAPTESPVSASASPDDEPEIRDLAERTIDPEQVGRVLRAIPGWRATLSETGTTRPAFWLRRLVAHGPNAKYPDKIVAYITQTLDNWIKKGTIEREDRDAATAVSKPPAGPRVGSGTLEARRAEESKLVAAEAQLQSRWDRLDGSERAAIRAGVEAGSDCQGLPERFRASFIRAACLDAMRTRS